MVMMLRLKFCHWSARGEKSQMSRSCRSPHSWTVDDRRAAITMLTCTGDEFHEMCWPRRQSAGALTDPRQVATLKALPEACLNRLVPTKPGQNDTIQCRSCCETFARHCWYKHVAKCCRRLNQNDKVCHDEDSWLATRFASVLVDGKCYFYMRLCKKKVLSLVNEHYDSNFIPPPPGRWFDRNCLRMLCAQYKLEADVTEAWMTHPETFHEKCIRLVGMMGGLKEQLYECQNRAERKKLRNKPMPQDALKRGGVVVDRVVANEEVRRLARRNLPAATQESMV